MPCSALPSKCSKLLVPQGGTKILCLTLMGKHLQCKSIATSIQLDSSNETPNLCARMKCWRLQRARTTHAVLAPAKGPTKPCKLYIFACACTFTHMLQFMVAPRVCSPVLVPHVETQIFNSIKFNSSLNSVQFNFVSIRQKEHTKPYAHVKCQRLPSVAIALILIAVAKAVSSPTNTVPRRGTPMMQAVAALRCKVPTRPTCM